jgi:hypothetical protein
MDHGLQLRTDRQTDRQTYVYPGMHKFSKNLGANSKSLSLPQEWHKECSSWQPTKFSRHGDLAPGICAPLHLARLAFTVLPTVLFFIIANTKIFSNTLLYIRNVMSFSSSEDRKIYLGPFFQSLFGRCPPFGVWDQISYPYKATGRTEVSCRILALLLLMGVL